MSPVSEPQQPSSAGEWSEPDHLGPQRAAPEADAVDEADSRILPTAGDEQREAALEAAAAAIRRGRLVVMPTDTVYGIGADAFEAAAVRRLLAAKGRGRDMPPPVLISSAVTADALAQDLPPYARRLMDAFWPGALTLVCRQRTTLQWDLGETRGTVALRMPDHPLTRDLLERTGPLAVSSANLTGRPAALTARQAEQMLGEDVAVYLDAGAGDDGDGGGGLPSTIVDATGPRGRILRAGALSLEELDAALEPLGTTLVDEG